jgi:hypothetical protein
MTPCFSTVQDAEKARLEADLENNRFAVAAE